MPAGELGSALADQLPQLIAFVLSFALVADVWWLHHKYFSLLEEIEPVLIAINLVLLMAVAVIPFPTSLIGNEPTAQAAVLPYIGVLVVLSLLYAAMLVRAAPPIFGGYSSPPASSPGSSPDGPRRSASW